MTTPKIIVGQRIRLYTKRPFRDANDQAFDPAVVRFRYLPPGGTETVLIHGTDPEVVKTAVGTYEVEIDVQTPGRWYFRVEGRTGQGQFQGSDDSQFEVVGSKFDVP